MPAPPSDVPPTMHKAVTLPERRRWRIVVRVLGRGSSDETSFMETEYLFFLYDDQGPVWDFGGPEGAVGGFLSVPEPNLLLPSLASFMFLRNVRHAKRL